MIKSDIDIVDEVYTAIKPFVSSLVGTSGKFLRDQRELNSTSMDAVLKLISNSIAQLQIADLTLNIYVADKLVKGQYVADTSLIRTKSRALLDYFASWNSNNKKVFTLSLDAQRVYEQQTNEHIISCRLKYKVLTD